MTIRVSPAPPVSGDLTPQRISLVERLAAALERERVRCCQWKGHAPGRTLPPGDCDILVDRADMGRLARVLARLGFRLALPSAHNWMPGVFSYLGRDPDIAQLIHIHVHCHVVIGRSWAAHYRLAIEDSVLDTAVPKSLFRVPAPEFALLLFVLRMTMRHSVRDAARARGPDWLHAAQAELGRLERMVDRRTLERTLARHVPEVESALFDRCRDSLSPQCPSWSRLAARRELERELSPHRCRPGIGFRVSSAVCRIAALAGFERAEKRCSQKRFITGGSVIALAGADGSGKSTCAAALEAWLAGEVLTRRAHLGRPPRSLTTLVVGAALKIAVRLFSGSSSVRLRSALAHLELLRHLCTARDRHRLYRRVQRFAAAGGIAICERYPIPEDYPLVGPSSVRPLARGARSELAEWLRGLETRYYTRLARPDRLFLLHVDPETAVRRKPEEPSPYVRARASIVRDTDWTDSGACIIDAGLPLADVIATLRARVWEAL